ncbi:MULTISPECIES: ATP-binding cassette domain-containing protein [spotted fever group]|uniref:ABC transporter domain-containing protein n=1 Tax=Rickettsia tamurae subsp. buchneri TaxID=1462938 RepID=A0A8E0WN17_9RICK|nr:ATP-binding cassette domain-containing protein [Rickettsia tamurae]EER21824.1 ABC transporter, ATP-binding protein [Rickettsia endosymbiont of Ixodes scapularis]KDO03673.1 hypothetical protein REISMN_00415 [Rickettsia tamurae subsp. buchneri]
MKYQRYIIIVSTCVFFLRTYNAIIFNKNYDVINAPSGGQKKKIGIIKAIISNPKILILDEVFANLDKTSIENVQQALKEFLPETLMLVVHHNGKFMTIIIFMTSI